MGERAPADRPRTKLLGSVSSARHRIEAHRGRELQLRRVFATSVVPMFLLDNERRIVEANPAARLLLRASSADLRLYDAARLTPPHMATQLEAAWEELQRTGRVCGSYDLLLPDGSLMNVNYCMVANVLPGLHLAAGMPASWPQDELGADLEQAGGGEDRPSLSPRERQVLALSASGADLARIAEELTISPLTAKTHLRNVHRRLGARNRAHAITLAIEHGLLDPPG